MITATVHTPDSEGDPRVAELHETPYAEIITASTGEELAPREAITPGNGEEHVIERPGTTGYERLPYGREWSLETLDYMSLAEDDPLYEIREDLR